MNYLITDCDSFRQRRLGLHGIQCLLNKDAGVSQPYARFEPGP